MRKKALTKKGYFFLIDGIFAVVILMIGFIIIMSQRPHAEENNNLEIVSGSIMELFSKIRVSQLCDGCSCSVKKLGNYCSRGMVKNTNQGLFDYLGELYYLGKKQEAGDLFLNITYSQIRQDLYGVELLINNERVTPQIEKGHNLISRKGISFSFYEIPETGEVRFFGPYKIEVNFWEK